MRQRAAETEELFIHYGRAAGSRDTEQGEAHISQKALQYDVADRRRCQQSAEQAVFADRGKTRVAP